MGLERREEERDCEGGEKDQRGGEREERKETVRREIKKEEGERRVSGSSNATSIFNSHMSYLIVNLML